MTDTATTISTPNGAGSDLRPDDIAQRRFATSFRGYDTDEVRSFLTRVAAQSRTLHERIAGLGAELDAARTVQPAPVIDLTQAEAETVVEESRDSGEAERALAEALVENARQEAALILARANDEAARIVLRARAESRGKPADGGRVVVTGDGPDDVEAARVQARAMIAEARAVRERILTDLAKRRRTAHIQLEQLRAAREKLQETMREARRVIDASSRDLSHVEVEARLAAEAAGRRVAAEPLPTVEELDAELSGGRFAAYTTSGSSSAGSLGSPDELGAAVDPLETAEAPEAEHEETEVEPAPVVVVAEVQDEPSAASPVELADTVASADVAEVPVAATDGEPDEQAVLDVALAPVENADQGQGDDADDQVPTPVALVPIEAGDDIEMVTVIEDPTRPIVVGTDEAVVVVITEETAMVELEDGRGTVTLLEETTTWEIRPSEPEVAEVEVAEVEVEVAEVAETTMHETSGLDSPVAEVPVAVAPVSAEAPPVRRRKVDDLFAKLRAEREANTERAREVLSAAPLTTDGSSALAEEQAPDADPIPVADPDLEPSDSMPSDAALSDPVPATVLQLAPTPATEPAASPAPVVPAAELTEPGPSPLSPDDEAVLERREHALELVRVRAAKQLKRHLQDEHGAALAQLRRSRGRVSVDNLLGLDEDQTARCVSLVLPTIEEAAAAGQRLVAVTDTELPRLQERCRELATQLAVALSGPLRTRLADAIDDGEHDLASVMGQAYREWTTDRLSERVREVLDAGFAAGAFFATDPGVAVRWVLDDGDEPCSDCDDNVLNGVQAWGEPFPTGELYPPVHAGCRCLVVPEGPLPGLIE